VVTYERAVAADPLCSAVSGLRARDRLFGLRIAVSACAAVVAAPQRPIGVEMAQLTNAAIASLDGYVEPVDERRFRKGVVHLHYRLSV
jgi:hypothetical protein